MAYRSGEDVMLRVQRRLAAVQQLLPRLTETYAELLGDDVPHERIAEMAADLQSQDPESLEAELADIEQFLRSAIADAPRLAAELCAVAPDLPRNVLGDPWIGPDVTHVDLEGYASRPVGRHFDTARLARAIGRLDPSCRHVDQLWESYRIESLRIEGAPFAMAIGALPLSDEVDLRLVTTVARAIAPVRLVRQTWLHNITTAVRLQVDALTGDRRFDEHFLVTANERAARRVLDDDLRRELLDFAEFSTPELTLGDGLAELRYRYDFSEMLLERALGLLTRLRARPLTLELVTPG